MKITIQEYARECAEKFIEEFGVIKYDPQCDWDVVALGQFPGEITEENVVEFMHNFHSFLEQKYKEEEIC